MNKIWLHKHGILLENIIYVNSKYNSMMRKTQIITQEQAPEYEKLCELQNSAKLLTEDEKKKVNVSYFLRKIGF